MPVLVLGILAFAIAKLSEKKNTELEPIAFVDERDAVPTDDGSSCPDNKHPHAIDLGLPSGTKWACCNIGAYGPHDYGDYYRWGETTPMREGDTMESYLFKGVDVGQNISGTRYDAAMAQWGNQWRMPTEEQVQELMDYCTFTWTTQNGVNGALIEGKNGRSVFFPASGYRNNGSSQLHTGGTYGYCWSASAYSSGLGHNLYFNSRGFYWDNSYRAYGFPVRAVAK